MPDNQHDLPAVVLGERRDHQPLLPAPAIGIHEAFLLEAVQGAADRGAAQPHPLGDGALGDPAAGRELARDDELAELVIHPPDAVGAVVGGRGAIAADGPGPGGVARGIEGRHRPQGYRGGRRGATDRSIFGIPLWYFRTGRRFGTSPQDFPRNSGQLDRSDA